jgi:diphthamide synthase (EF-2-diphthine--ammonia ligase)
MNPQQSQDIAREGVALAWSGGKDSMLALHVLQQSGIEVVALLTTASVGIR